MCNCVFISAIFIVKLDMVTKPEKGVSYRVVAALCLLFCLLLVVEIVAQKTGQ